MLAAITAVDYGVLALYLMVMIAIGAYFSRQQKSSQDFFLAGRSMSWFPVGLSIMATLLSALSYSGIPGEAYYVGFKFLLLPLAIWCCLPIVSRFILPLFRGLQLYSIYEYLELRFDAPTRFVSSFVFVIWRLLWLGGVLYAPSKVLVVAAGLDWSVELLIIILGLAATAYTFLGGMKAVIWTDVIQSIVMVGGLIFIIGAIWSNLEGGAPRVWEVASSLGRTEVADTKFDMSEKWPLWGIFPHFILSMLSFYIADQITAQRYLTASSLNTARRSFALNCVSATIMIPALVYMGMGLLAFYHDNPQSMQPKWVVNLDNQSRESLTYADRDKLLGKPPPPGAKPDDPLIDWKNDEITPKSIGDLVREGRVFRPNLRGLFEEGEIENLKYLDGESERIDVNKLLMRRPKPLESDLKRGEVLLNKKAKDELMPRFITEHLPMGIAGLILAALFAASMSSMDSGLNSISTICIMDFHRRLGWGRRWLARRVGTDPDELTEEHELKLGRPLVLVIGVAATLFALFVAQIDDIFQIMIGVVNTFGGPLLAIFLLGIFTRRTTARAALLALIIGMVFTIWMMASNTYDAFSSLWPFEKKLNSVWIVIFGVGFTLVMGYVLSFICGLRKSRDDLRGLVVGIGHLGEQSPDKPPTIDISGIQDLE
ncbi:MAG: hypothetical protein IH991_03515 [Planctomycetes bacterium]|nr:hypothetical protein [Planctomycetota bacterium]